MQFHGMLFRIQRNLYHAFSLYLTNKTSFSIKYLTAGIMWCHTGFETATDPYLLDVTDTDQRFTPFPF